MRRAVALSAVLLVLCLGFLTQLTRASDQDAATGTEPQVVAGPIPEKVTSSSVVVWWQTTAPQESILVYGPSAGDMTYRVQRPWRTTTHEISLKKLQPSTTYYLAILQPDGVRSATGQFTTQAAGYSQRSSVRITNGPLFEQITSHSATIAWSTNHPSSFLVRYGTDPQNLTRSAPAPWTPTTHRVVLGDLRSDTRYYFAIESGAETSRPVPPEQDSSLENPASAPAQIYAFRTLDRGQQALNIGPQH